MVPAAPEPWRELDEREHGNKVLFLRASPADSGKTVEVRYRVKRFEKAEYAVRKPAPQQYLKAESLVPANDNFRAIAEKITHAKTTDLARPRGNRLEVVVDHGGLGASVELERHGCGAGAGGSS